MNYDVGKLFIPQTDILLDFRKPVMFISHPNQIGPRIPEVQLDLGKQCSYISHPNQIDLRKPIRFRNVYTLISHPNQICYYKNRAMLISHPKLNQLGIGTRAHAQKFYTLIKYGHKEY